MTTNESLRPPVYRQHHYVTVVAVMAAVAVLAPRWAAGSRADQYLVNLWLAYSIAAIGAYWIYGLAGRFFFCQTFMMVLGGFTTAWVTRDDGGGQSPLVGLVAAVAVTAAIAAIVAIAIRRSHEFYFAIATLALAQVGTSVFRRWEGFAGRNGTTVGIAPIDIAGHRFLDESEIFWLLAGLLTAVLLLAVLIERSPLRRDALAGRANPLVARTIGLPLERNQVVLFSLGSAMGGLSGGLIAHWNGVIGIDSFGIDLAIGFFLMLLLGGITSPWGPVLGAAFYVAVPHWLAGAERYSEVVYGVMLLIVVVALPEGLVGAVRRASAYVRSRAATTVESRRTADAAG